MAPISAPVEEIVHPPLRQVPVGAGLCRSCVKAPGCTFPRSPGHIVRSCDEFEGADGPRSGHASLTAASSVLTAGGSAGAGAPEFKGLCAQCSRRATCAYPKPAGGVWHCEELA